MNTTLEYLDAVKSKLGGASDYRLAKVLGVAQQTVSGYRVNGFEMDDKVCLKVAEILGIDAAIVLASIHAKRAKTEAEKTAWKLIYERLGGIAASVLIATLLAAAPSAPAKTDSRNGSHTVYIMSNRKRKLNPNRFLAILDTFPLAA